jgi:hypothetical protein
MLEAQDVIQDITITLADLIRNSQALANKSLLLHNYVHIEASLKYTWGPGPQTSSWVRFIYLRGPGKSDRKILKMEGQPVPKGFGDEDIDFGAPSFSRIHITITILLIWSELDYRSAVWTLLIQSGRMLETFLQRLLWQQQSFLLAFQIMLEKGIYIRRLSLYLQGSRCVGETELFTRFFRTTQTSAGPWNRIPFPRVETNIVGGALAAGFQQVARSEQVRGYMARELK